MDSAQKTEQKKQNSWRNLGRQLAQENGLTQREIVKIFRNTVVNRYRQCLPKAGDVGNNAFARKCGFDKSTASRFLNGNVKGLGFPQLCMAAAAFDAEFPRGYHAALDGFCETFQHVQNKITEENSTIEPEELLCLFCTIRWLDPKLIFDSLVQSKKAATDDVMQTSQKTLQTTINELLGKVVNDLQLWVPDILGEEEVTITSIEEVQNAIDGKLLAFAIMKWAIANNDWF